MKRPILKCRECGDTFRATEDETPHDAICDECFNEREFSHQNPEYEETSDADPGL